MYVAGNRLIAVYNIVVELIDDDERNMKPFFTLYLIIIRWLWRIDGGDWWFFFAVLYIYYIHVVLSQQ